MNAAQKRLLRIEFLKKRGAISPGERVELDRAIYDNFTGSEFAALDNFFIYLNFKSEPSTRQIIDFLLEKGKGVAVPKTYGKEMIPQAYTRDLIKDKTGIEVPKSDEPFLGKIDLALVPMLSAARNGARLGYGGGYYDRFLAGRDIIKVGVIYSALLSDKLPCEPHDIKMDYILTERGIFKVKT